MMGSQTTTSDALLAEQVARIVQEVHGLRDAHEADDLAAILRRSAAIERAGPDLLAAAVAVATERDHSYAAIARELGVTRQAVSQRFGP